MSFTLSINPTYFCNFRCHFCYLTEEQLGNRKYAKIQDIASRLDELKACGVDVKHVDLYGGEIGLLDDAYLEEIDEAIRGRFDSVTINVVTNLSQMKRYFLRKDVSLSVSYDFSVRQDSDRVLKNIMKLDKDVSILMLASKELMQLNVEEMVSTFNIVGNITSVEIKPYSPNQANQNGPSYTEFEGFVTKWLSLEKRFDFINQFNIEDSLSGSYNAFSDNHLYITPNGKFAVLDFDEDDNELFLELNSYNDYLLWSEIEKNSVKSNSYCSKCEFLGKCLTEHYRRVESLDNSCNGFYNLLKSTQNTNNG